MKKILIFEGCDKTGKDTIIEAVKKKINFKHVIVNRFIGSHWVYDQLKRHKTRDDVRKWLDFEISINLSRYLQFILHASPFVVAERMKETNETDIKFNEIETVLYYYWEWSKVTMMKTFLINTDKPIEESVEKICQLIDENT